jgi:hypothetical protein
MDSFTINTKTTGFGSPARAYSTKRLDPNDLLITDPYSTFFLYICVISLKLNKHKRLREI